MILSKKNSGSLGHDMHNRNHQLLWIPDSFTRAWPTRLLLLRRMSGDLGYANAGRHGCHRKIFSFLVS